MKFCMQKFFFGKCLFAYKIRFAVEKKNKKILGQFFKITLKILSLSKKCQSYSFHIWKLYGKHFLHTLDVWNCMIMIFVVWNCMISIFGVWRSTRERRESRFLTYEPSKIVSQEGHIRKTMNTQNELNFVVTVSNKK